jgi:hypothetical protein
MNLTSDAINSFDKWDGESSNFKAKIISSSNDNYRVAGYRDKLDVIHVIIYSDCDSFQKISRTGMSVEFKRIDIIDEGLTGVLDFSCNSIGFKHNFITILNDIIKSAEKTKNLKVSANQVVDKWFYFLQLPRKQSLDFGKMIGLTGELLSLERLIIYTQNTEKCLKAWVGPLGARRDFVFENIVFEVKTSAKQNGHIHTINGIDQLDKTEDESVYIYSWNIVKDYSESAITINDVIDRITQLIVDSESLKEIFISKLYEAGYDIRDKDEYESEKLRIQSDFIVEVDNFFPVITRESFKNKLNNRIIRVEYEIDINGYKAIDLKYIFNGI